MISKKSNSGPTRRAGVSVLAAVAGLLTNAPALPSAETVQEKLGVGNHAPPLKLIDLAGETHDLRWGTGAAQTTVFFFFDARSTPSMLGISYLDRVFLKVHDAGLDVLAVEASGISRQQITGIMDRYNAIYPAISYPVIPDPEGLLRRTFGVDELPATFLVERHGVIYDHRIGFDESTAGGINIKLSKGLHLPGDVLGEGQAGSTAAAQPEETEPRGHLLFPGDKAPPLDITDISGKKHVFNWSSAVTEINIIFFWDNPCRPCIEQILFLDRIYLQALDLGLPLRILAIEAGGLDAAATQAILQRYGKMYSKPSFPFVLDADSGLSRIFGWGELPSTYIMDEKGIVINRTDGFEDKTAGEWTSMIENTFPLARGALRE